MKTDSDALGPNPPPSWERDLVKDHPADASSARFRPGKGLEFKSADGRFALVTRLRGQFRYEYEGVAGGPDEEVFHIRRARLQFVGNMWGKHNTFKIELAFSPRDEDLTQPTVVLQDPTGMGMGVTGTTRSNVVGTTPLLDWYMTFDYLRDLTLRVGQYKVPYSRQRVISSGNLQFVDRAITNGEFTLDRDLGLDFRSKDLLGLGLFRYYAGVYIGEGRNTSDRTPGAGDLGLMYLIRFELLPFGMFKDYSEADFERTAKPRLSLGVGYAYLQNAPGVQGIKGRAPEADDDTFHNANADLLFKYAGLSVLGDFYWRDGRGGTDLADGIGWMLQGGYLLPGMALELGARFGMTRPGGDASVLKGKNELGIVGGYYFARHPFKLQADLFQLWGYGEQRSQGVVRLRVQLQAAF
ncbi:MAG: OprO/OprP family phosphate-selective porin [Proteobacteria bacterium]|nr:OprO/OprP family phosphate-selective porin [Pseudomonadota bacterium]